MKPKEDDNDSSSDDQVIQAVQDSGDVRLFVIADGKKSTVLLMNVYFASSVARNIVSYGKLDTSGYTLLYLNGKRVVARRSDVLAVFDVVIQNSSLVVRTVGMLARTIEPVNVIMAALPDELAADTSPVMQRGSLLHSQQRLGQFAFDTIEKIAKNPSSGIELTDKKRMR
ncbi:unnamed protein product [Peronospora belbahrii]|uniref:Uncharacterized protein n=1 Tax=Peronospora belbahrii TaxID=622444 RepID=A0AAU9LC82_9STRA|nr:unnamed protein product [Peronospora belbahrii]